MKRLAIVSFLLMFGLLKYGNAQWADFTNYTQASNLSRAMNSKVNLQIGSGAPTMNCTAPAAGIGGDVYADITNFLWYLCVSTNTWQKLPGSATFEPPLGNPSVSGYILSSTTAGVRSWIAPEGTSTPGTSGQLLTSNGSGGFGASLTPGALALVGYPSAGLVKSSGSAFSVASAGSDYEVPLTFGSGVTRTINAVTCNAASGSVAGCLSAADWTTFNGKQTPISGAPGTWPSFGTAALVNTGTSAGTVPLLNGVNTWSGAQTFSSTLNKITLTAPATAWTIQPTGDNQTTTIPGGTLINSSGSTSGNAGTATNLAGGTIGQIPYQSAANTTLFVTANTAATDQVLVSHGSGSAGLPPTLTNAPALSGANMTNLPALGVKSDGTLVGTRSLLNIIPGLGIAPVVTDTGTQINITLPIDTAVTDTRLNAASGVDLLVTPASGSGTAYTGCPTGITPPLTTGMVVHLTPDHTSTGGATTFNYCATTALALKEADGTSNLTSTDLIAGRQQDIWYDGSLWRLKRSLIEVSSLPASALAASTFDAQGTTGTITWAIGSVLNAQATSTFTTHTGTATLAVTNPVIGGNYVWKLIQDATGGITATLGSGCTWLVANGGTPSGAHVITLTNAPNAVDVLAFVYDGTNCLASVIYNLKP